MTWLGVKVWLAANKLMAALGAVSLIAVLAVAAWMLAVHRGEELERARNADRITRSVIKDAGIKGVLDVAQTESDRKIADLKADLEKADDQQAAGRPADTRLAYLCRVREQQGGASKLPPTCRPYTRP